MRQIELGLLRVQRNETALNVGHSSDKIKWNLIKWGNPLSRDKSREIIPEQNAIKLRVKINHFTSIWLNSNPLTAVSSVSFQLSKMYKLENRMTKPVHFMGICATRARACLRTKPSGVIAKIRSSALEKRYTSSRTRPLARYHFSQTKITQWEWLVKVKKDRN